MGISIGFWLLASTAVIAALAVVTMRGVFRTALALVVCFLSVAGLFITLSADFLGTVQILLYVGAIAILLIIAIMLTKQHERGDHSANFRPAALIASVIFAGLVVWAALATAWPSTQAEPTTPTAGPIGSLLLSQDGLALVMEIAGLLLLATIIGAVSLAREE